MTTSWEVRRAWTARLVSAGAKHADLTVALVIRDFVWTDDGYDLTRDTIRAHSTLKDSSVGRSVKRLREAGALVTRETFGPNGKITSLRYFPVWDFDLGRARAALSANRGSPYRAASPTFSGDRRSDPTMPGQDQQSPTVRIDVPARSESTSCPVTAERALVFPEIYPEESSGNLGLYDLRPRKDPGPTLPGPVGVGLEHVAELAGLPRPRLGFVRSQLASPPVEPRDGLTAEEREESVRQLRERRLACAKRMVLTRTTPFRGQPET